MLLRSLLPLAELFAALVTVQIPGAALSSAPSFPAPDLSKIKSVPQSRFKSYKPGSLHHASIQTTSSGPSGPAPIQKRWECTQSPVFTPGDADDTIGIRITNGDPAGWRGFYVYHNSCDSSPYKYTWIEPGATHFLSLPSEFVGRIVRGEDYLLSNGQTQRLATLFEFAFDDAGRVWGDVSLIRGTDGAVLMWSEDGSGAWKGWDWWVLDGAPGDAYAQKPNGQWVLKGTVNDDNSINVGVRDYLMKTVGADKVYVDDDHGHPVISSTNGRFSTYWGPGRP